MIVVREGRRSELCCRGGEMACLSSKRHSELIPGGGCANTSNDLCLCPGRNICRTLDRLLPVSSVHGKRQTVVPKRCEAGTARTVSRKGHCHRCDIAIARLRPERARPRTLPQAEDCANPVTALQHLKSYHCPSHVGGFDDPPRGASETTRTRFGDPVGDTQPRSTI